MAWGAKARNNSAISRNVNYHEDEGPSGNNNNNNGGGNRGGGSKIMRVVAVGFAIYMVANIGLGGAGEVLSNIGDALDFGKEVGQTINETKGNVKGKSDSNGDYKKVNNKAKIEADDLSDILDFLSEELQGADVSVSNGEVITIDYSSFKNDIKYRKDIISKLDKYKTTVSFMAVNSELLSEEEMNNEFNRISEIVSSNKDKIGNGFRKYTVNGLKNVTGSGTFVFSVTFVK